MYSLIVGYVCLYIYIFKYDCKISVHTRSKTGVIIKFTNTRRVRNGFGTVARFVGGASVRGIRHWPPFASKLLRHLWCFI